MSGGSPGRAPVAPDRAATGAVARRRSLAWRLGTVLAVVVLAVLLIVGAVVNRVVNTGFASVVTEAQQQRIQDAATTIGERIERPVGLARAQALARRLATNLGGQIRIVGLDGAGILVAGDVPPGSTVELSAPIEIDGAIVATLEASLPARGPATGAGFLPLFNATLVIAGIASLVLIVLVSTTLAERLTRPLRDVAEAARRLGSGETTARATGGDDRESADLAAAFNAMADRLERSEMLRRRAATDIAHDLATPATVLETELQAMLDGVVPTDRASLEAARNAAAALATIVTDLDDLAAAEAAPLQARPAEVDAAEVVGAAIRGLEALSRQRSVAIMSEVQPGIGVWADGGQLERAVRNVVANAVAHSPAGSAVRITAGVTATAQVVLRVVDEGPGIDAVDLPHVFERFYRSDRSRSTGSGRGLGLTIAREFLAANGGRIEVESTGSGGTTFRLEIPAAPSPR